MRQRWLNRKLRKAVKKNDIDVARQLITEGADVNHIAGWVEDQSSPGFYAVRNDNAEMLAVLLDAGLNPNLSKETEYTGNCSLLRYAAEHNRFKCLDLLLKTDGIDMTFSGYTNGNKLKVTKRGDNRLPSLLQYKLHSKAKEMIVFAMMPPEQKIEKLRDDIERLQRHKADLLAEFNRATDDLKNKIAQKEQHLEDLSAKKRRSKLFR